MIVVQVIGPFETARYEFHYADGTTDEAILADLTKEDTPQSLPKRDLVGFVRVKGTDPATGKPAVVNLEDAEGYAVYAVDHPQTVIAIGELKMENGWKLFAETRRLRGPAA